MKIIAKLKLKIYAGKANALPPIGPALGQKGINIMEFCKNFNEKTKNYDSKMKLPVLIFIYSNKNYRFTIFQPSVTDLIKNYKNIKKGAVNPGREICCTMTTIDIIKIAKKKIIDMKITKLLSAIKVVEGIAISMGVCILK